MSAVIAVAVSVIAIAAIICVIVVLAPILTRWITAYWEWEERLLKAAGVGLIQKMLMALEGDR